MFRWIHGDFLWATFFLLCGFGGLRYGSGVSGGSRCAHCCSAKDDGMLFQIILPQRQRVAQQVNAGVQNIFNAYQNDFDKGADRDSGYIYGPSLPRSFFAGVKISY